MNNPLKVFYFLFLWWLLLFAATPSFSSSPPEKWKALKKELKSRRSGLVSPLVHKKLDRIHRIMNRKGEEDRALILIEKLEKLVQNRKHELAKVYYLKAQVYFSHEKLKKALIYYKKALDLKKLSYSRHLSVLFDMANLYLHQNNLKKAEMLVDQIMYLSDNIPANVYILKASIFVERDQKTSALKMVMKAINSAVSPKESWLAFAASLYLEMKNYIKAAKLLEKLTASHPSKKKYWKQLSAVYLNINKEDSALAVLDLSYKMDFLEKEREILHLAGLLLYQGQPLKAAELIERSIKLKKIKNTYKNQEILGDCWNHAEEIKRALLAYEKADKQASDKDLKNGKFFAKIGRLYLNQEKWQKAVKFLKKALDKGGIKKPEFLYISMGNAQYHLKQYQPALLAFEQVIVSKTASSRLIKTAREWINFIHKKQPQLKNL